MRIRDLVGDLIDFDGGTATDDHVGFRLPQADPVGIMALPGSGNQAGAENVVRRPRSVSAWAQRGLPGLGDTPK